MNISLYNFVGKTNELNKTLTSITEKTVTIKDVITNIDDFYINLLSFDEWQNVNYAYIEKLKRYYFITSKDVYNNSLVRFHLHIDLLMSFKDYILELNATILTSENNYNASFANTEKNIDFKNKQIEIKTDFIKENDKMILVVEK